MNADVSRIRNIAIVGPYSSGKTTLLESILFLSGATNRQGRIRDGNTVGDSSPEARDRGMGVEVNAASTLYKGVQFNWLDCPGSVELSAETYNVLVGVDAAVVVCEPMVDRAIVLAPLFQFLDAWQIPHVLFINKMDRSASPIAEILSVLRPVSSRPLVMHQYPIRQGNSPIGYIDLVSETAYRYHPGVDGDDPIPLPDNLRAEEQAARHEMLETLADHDDRLLEKLLDDIQPSEEEIVLDLQLELGADQIVPVFVGVAEQHLGVRPLLDALLREAPEPNATAVQRGVDAIAEDDRSPIVQVLKTLYTNQGGKLSIVRVWNGTIEDGASLGGVRIGGIYRLMGNQQKSLTQAVAGDIVALARLDGVMTGEVLAGDRAIARDELPRAELPAPMFAWAIVPENRSDEVKLTAALGKLVEEDPAIHWEQHGDTHEVILWGQGEIHLNIAIDRLRRKYNLPMTPHLPQVPYKETIRKPVNRIHGRYKHQTGGHGQFGDVYLDIQPQPRGAGYDFHQKIVGGVVPKQYIPGVESGVRESLDRGPLGFPVVDVAITLTDGSYHSVDSSEQAFKMAAQAAMKVGIPAAEPVLLEPINRVEIAVPSEFTAKVMQLVTGRRGQLMGYEAKDGWPGWDVMQAYLPHAEMQNLILELRSLTLGVGTFCWQHDHLQEVPDKLADRVLAKSDR
jgi:elongation factor G